LGEYLLVEELELVLRSYITVAFVQGNFIANLCRYSPNKLAEVKIIASYLGSALAECIETSPQSAACLLVLDLCTVALIVDGKITRWQPIRM
jgi:hypothetical protein